jgi:hypothetical protein
MVEGCYEEENREQNRKTRKEENITKSNGKMLGERCWMKQKGQSPNEQ